MNRLDATQVSEPAGPLIPTDTALVLSWALPLLGVGVAVFYAYANAPNPVDRAFLAMAYVPLGLIAGDFWAAGLALLRRRVDTPLRVPLTTPLVLGGLHLGLGAAVLRLVRFDTLYEYVPVDGMGGTYEIRLLIAVPVVAAAGLALVVALLEGRLVRWVLISERTAKPRFDPGSVQPAEDRELGPENVYEAQALLNNLGYEFGAIDGVLTADTSSALERFQRAADIEVSGRVTALTMIELRNQWKAAEESPRRASMWAMARHVGRRLAHPLSQATKGIRRSSK